MRIFCSMKILHTYSLIYFYAPYYVNSFLINNVYTFTYTFILISLTTRRNLSEKWNINQNFFRKLYYGISISPLLKIENYGSKYNIFKFFLSKPSRKYANAEYVKVHVKRTYRSLSKRYFNHCFGQKFF